MEQWSSIGLLSRLDPLVQRRRSVCWACPQRSDHGLGGGLMVLLGNVLIDEPKDGPFVRSWCSACRCYLPLKSRMKWAHCPLGYW